MECLLGKHLLPAAPSGGSGTPGSGGRQQAAAAGGATGQCARGRLVAVTAPHSLGLHLEGPLALHGPFWAALRSGMRRGLGFRRVRPVDHAGNQVPSRCTTCTPRQLTLGLPTCFMAGRQSQGPLTPKCRCVAWLQTNVADRLSSRAIQARCQIMHDRWKTSRHRDGLGSCGPRAPSTVSLARLSSTTQNEIHRGCVCPPAVHGGGGSARGGGGRWRAHRFQGAAGRRGLGGRPTAVPADKISTRGSRRSDGLACFHRCIRRGDVSWVALLPYTCSPGCTGPLPTHSISQSPAWPNLRLSPLFFSPLAASAPSRR